jgi:hypothetical protein
VHEISTLLGKLNTDGSPRANRPTVPPGSQLTDAP